VGTTPRLNEDKASGGCHGFRKGVDSCKHEFEIRTLVSQGVID
jgi:hypothetical protein